MRYEQTNLTPAEEISLGSRIQVGLQAATILTERVLEAPEKQKYERLREDGLAARNALTRANLRFAESRVRRFTGADRDTEEMRADAFESLCIAAGRFDPDYGTRFSTYAGVIIDRGIQHNLDVGGLVRETSNVAKARRKFNRKNLLTLETLRPPYSPPMRMDPLDGSEMKIPSSAPCHTERHAERSEIAMLLALMTGRQSQVIRLMYGLRPDDESMKNMSEVARILGVTVQTVSGIHQAALNRARNGLAMAA